MEFSRIPSRMGIGRICFNGSEIADAPPPGAIAGIVAKLADAGVNITALDAVAAGAGRYGAILWVKPKDVAKAAKALGAK